MAARREAFNNAFVSRRPCGDTSPKSASTLASAASSSSSSGLDVTRPYDAAAAPLNTSPVRYSRAASRSDIRLRVVNEMIAGVSRDLRGRQLVAVRGHNQKLQVSRSYAGLFKGM